MLQSMILINSKEQPTNKNRNQRKNKDIDSRIEDQDHEVRKERRSIRKKENKTVLRVVKNIGRETIENTHNLSIDNEKENKRDIDTIPQVANDKHNYYFIYFFELYYLIANKGFTRNNFTHKFL